MPIARVARKARAITNMKRRVAFVYSIAALSVLLTVIISYRLGGVNATILADEPSQKDCSVGLVVPPEQSCAYTEADSSGEAIFAVQPNGAAILLPSGAVIFEEQRIYRMDFSASRQADGTWLIHSIPAATSLSPTATSTPTPTAIPLGECANGMIIRPGQGCCSNGEVFSVSSNFRDIFGIKVFDNLIEISYAHPSGRFITFQARKNPDESWRIHRFASGEKPPICALTPTSTPTPTITPTPTASPFDPNNPIPRRIEKGKITLAVQDVLRLPDTRHPPKAERQEASLNYARINVVRRAPDDSGRLFANDLRGQLYVLRSDSDGEYSVNTYLDMADEFPSLRLASSWASGFVSFALHPGFAKNGKIYTVHTEIAGEEATDFGPLDDAIHIRSHILIYEWTASDPREDRFNGERRSIMRIGVPFSGVHGAGDLLFNPVAKPGKPEYGKLYIAIGDNGLFSLERPDLLGRKDTVFGTVLRIDPNGKNSANGQYGIPAGNPFVRDENALDEVYAYGLRNPHRITWDEQNGIGYIFDIGENQIEEINILRAGSNYGWPFREGTFTIQPKPNHKTVGELPDDEPNYIYPVAQYDHDEGIAIANGYVYRGDTIPALYGNLVFGDIANGRLFYVDTKTLTQASDGNPKTMAEISELRLEREGIDIALYEIVTETLGGDENNPYERVDLRIALDNNGEILITTKTDGYIRRLAASDVADE